MYTAQSINNSFIARHDSDYITGLNLASCKHYNNNNISVHVYSYPLSSLRGNVSLTVITAYVVFAYKSTCVHVLMKPTHNPTTPYM